MVTIDDVRSVARTLPRSYEVVVRGRVKFRVSRIVYLAFSRDETLLGFAFPKEWRDALVETEPDKYLLPRESDLRSTRPAGCSRNGSQRFAALRRHGSETALCPAFPIGGGARKTVLRGHALPIES